MNAKYIKFYTQDEKEYAIANRWELLSPDIFLFLVNNLRKYAAGWISLEDIRYLYVCRYLGIKRLKDEMAVANIALLAEQIDFICDSTGKVNSCFLAQLVPTITLADNTYTGYKINTSFEIFTCTLTALQFIEASEVLNSDNIQKLPLLAAILYCELPYSSEQAHELAKVFTSVDLLTLEAIALNFQSFLSFLFTKTEFSILSSGGNHMQSEISIGLTETLYNLSADGMGDISAIEQMPVIKFLTILRKKLIESVRSMHHAKMDLMKISETTGLQTNLIKKMI